MDNLLSGFSFVLLPINFLACFIGVTAGTVVGVLPGLGPTTTMAMLLPLTLGMDPATGMIMLAGIWYGAQYGGSITSILINVPGEAASVVTCIDGYQMTKHGRGGAALAVAAIGSFVAGTTGVLGLQLFAPLLGEAALSFGPPEYMALFIFTLIALSNLSGGSAPKAFAMVTLGVLLSTVGLDPLTGKSRFTLSWPPLMNSLEFIPVVMGLFGISEMIELILGPYEPKLLSRVRLRSLYPTRTEMRRAWPAILRGSVLGFGIGLVPGPAAALSSFASYGLERKISSRSSEFGLGAIEGVAGPESANNSACCGALAPLLALGLPFAPPTAVLLSGLMMHGVTPGPLLIQEHPNIFWSVIASMYIGNILLIILNLPLVGLFAQVALIRPSRLVPVVLAICAVGAYSLNNALFDVGLMFAAGVCGFFFKRAKYPAAPLILGLLLGRMLEQSIRQSLILGHGSFGYILNRPVCIVFFILTVLTMVIPHVLKWGKGNRSS